MILTILKYFGLCLAAASSIWGTTHELTIKTAENRKRLTRAGIVSISFVVIGLVLNIISDSIGRERAAQEQYAMVVAEERRKNEIIIASQPLTSLNLALQFESSDTSFRRKMEDGERDIEENDMNVQGHSTRVPYGIKEYQSSLIPMLKYLARLGEHKHTGIGENNVSDSNGIVALIPLDDIPNTILSFGEIYGGVFWGNADSTHRLSAGFSPLEQESRLVATKMFSTDGPSKYGIEWNLDPITLEKSVDRVNAGIRLGAKLPRVLKLIILRISETLPFTQNNFALTGSAPWHIYPGESKNEASNVPAMTLSASVNGVSELAYHYKLAGLYHKPLYNEFGEEIEIGCTVFEFHLD